ncbi:tyrosine protein phosphatase yvh1 [Balamuthia mandrillaris]
MQRRRGGGAELPTEVLPGFLWVGNDIHGSDVNVLRSLGITRVVNVTERQHELTGKSKEQQETEEGQEATEAEFVVCFLPAKDHPTFPLEQHFAKALAFIEEAQRNSLRVLVHCAEGVSRSVTIATAYLMQSQQWTLRESILHVMQRRHEANPNNGFMRQLSAFEQQLFGSSSIDPSYFVDDWGWGCLQLKMEEAKTQASNQA